MCLSAYKLFVSGWVQEMDANDAIEDRLVVMLERGIENMAVKPQKHLSIGHVPRKFTRVQYVSKSMQFEVGKSIRGSLEWLKSKGTITNPRFQNRSLDRNPSSSSSSLEDLMSKYVKMVKFRVKNMEEVQRSKTTSLHTVENRIWKLTRMIIENLLDNKIQRRCKSDHLRKQKRVRKNTYLECRKRETAQAQVELTLHKDKEVQRKEVEKRK